ncbi:MAG: homoserine dehydrogenase [Pseudomonadota bacterium]
MPVPTLVLNFGHSVLRSLSDYTEAASEIYRHYRTGRNIVAVTSAQGDQTDVLIAEARRIGPEGDARNLPELLQLGERRSAALLALALERIGAPAFVRQARDLGLTATGDPMNAELTGLNTGQLMQDLKDHDIVVMPGFVAIGEKDRAVLLGQGGADLTALYVADQLGAPALLLKDVDGVYDRDPAERSDAPLKRYTRVSYADVRRKAGPLIASRALDYAESTGQRFRIGKPGVAISTQVGDVSDAPVESTPPRKLRIAMMGLGIVGGGVWRRVAEHPDRFEIVKVMVRSPQKYIDQGYPETVLTTDADDLFAADPDIFIDVSGPIEPALTLTRDMLAKGVHVVSANKQAIANGGQALLDHATSSKARLLFSSAAGGGMPVLEMCLREHGRIARVEALLNGTTNFMLGEMDAGMSYDDALTLAQDRGYAEADPTADVDGHDAAAKIRLVSLLGFGVELEPEQIGRDTLAGVDEVKKPGMIVKRVARVSGDTGEIVADLRLRALSPNNFLAQADGEDAHAVFDFTDGDRYVIRGKGAGRWPTTESVMADLYDLSNGSGT